MGGICIGEVNCDADMRRRLLSLDGGASTGREPREEERFTAWPICICQSKVGEMEAPSSVFSLRL